MAEEQESTENGAGGEEQAPGAPAGDAGEGGTILAGDPGEAPAEAPVVPEQYEFTMPEGMELDEAAAKAAGEVFKELGLTQEQADKLTALRVAEQQANAKAFEAQQQAWAQELQNDPDIGGEQLAANAAIARRAVDKLGDDGLRQLLNETGIGNNPSLFRAFLKMGRLMSEDSGVAEASAQSAPEPNMARRLYPSMYK